MRAEQTASPEGRRVLAKAREMVRDRVILPGSCWNYINAVFTRAGFPQDHRLVVFKGKKRGPYADLKSIRAGDWLYFVNHSYGGIEHSSIFIGWTDFGRRQALMFGYAGQNRREPGRYLEYDLTDTYMILRPSSTKTP